MCYPVSYAENAAIAKHSGEVRLQNGCVLADLAAPSSSVLLYESGDGATVNLLDTAEANSNGAVSGLGLGLSPYSAAREVSGCTSSIYDSRLNAGLHNTTSFTNQYLLADGHVKTLQVTKVGDPCNGSDPQGLFCEGNNPSNGGGPSVNNLGNFVITFQIQ